MRKLKIFMRSLTVLLAVVALVVFSAIVYADYSLSDDYLLVEGTQLNVNCQVPITSEFVGVRTSQESLVASGRKNEYEVNFKLLGLFPVASANVTVVDRTSVYLLGTPFGIKIYTDGVLVVKIDSVDSENGSVNVAKNAGVDIGDSIVSINGKKVYSNEDVAQIVANCEGNTLTLLIERDGKRREVTVQPLYSVEGGVYRIGIWVRDSTAGIGTLTFYSPINNVVCGLGHGIIDEDTQKLMSVSFGEIVGADIVACKKSTPGNPGELRGRLLPRVTGSIISNNELGIYAEAKCDFSESDMISVALKQEVTNGPAQIYTTIEGEEPKFYSCNIEIRKGSAAQKHNMVIEITDKELLDATGGIVQGMSGSPIIQNGKLIGAITHVLVDNPKKGYAIFAENMLETAQGVVNSINEAS